MKEALKLIKTLNKYGEVSNKRIIFTIFISIIIALLQAIPVKLIQKIMDGGFVGRNYILIIKLSFVLTLIYILKSALSYFLNKLSLLLSKELVENLREKFFNTILKSNYEVYSSYDSSYLNHRVNEASNVGDIFSPNTFRIFTTILESIFVFILLFRINYLLLIVLVIPIPLLFIIIKSENKKLEENTKILMEKISKQTQKVTEKISGLEYIQKNAKEKKEIMDMKNIDKDVFEAKYRQGLLNKKLTEIINLYISLLPILLYILGGYLYLNDGISIGGIVSFSANITKIYSPFLNIAIFTVSINAIKTSGKRIVKLFKEFNQNISDEEFNKINIKKIDNVIFDKVEFKYKSSESILFKNINFSLCKGEILKISGDNGSGKSTMLKLILGILKPDKGYIRINNCLYETLNLNSIKNRIGIVDQNIFLFNDSIKNNILYAFNENEISDNKLIEIIRLLKLDDSYSLEDINKNKIGQNGNNLSGGERQKIALARILLKDSDVVIFDESISNVDANTRKIIKKIILEQLQNKIVILVDHNDYFDDIITKKLCL